MQLDSKTTIILHEHNWVGVGGVEELLRKLCFRTKKEISRFPSEGTSRPPPLKEI